MLGNNGWSKDYERPLGTPRTPALFSVADQTLTRTFTSGTKVVFTYSDLARGQGRGVICWGGVCPPPGPPPPPAPQPAPPIGQCPSTVLPWVACKYA